MYTKINRRFLTVLSFLLLGMICLSFTSLWIGEGREIPLKKLDQGHKLMIVAHPDDESMAGMNYPEATMSFFVLPTGIILSAVRNFTM